MYVTWMHFNINYCLDKYASGMCFSNNCKLNSYYYRVFGYQLMAILEAFADALWL